MKRQLNLTDEQRELIWVLLPEGSTVYAPDYCTGKHCATKSPRGQPVLHATVKMVEQLYHFGILESERHNRWKRWTYWLKAEARHRPDIIAIAVEHELKETSC